MMRDSNICKLWKVHTLENESDLLAKIHDPDQFERLRNRCMVFQKFRRSNLTVQTQKASQSAAPTAEEAAKILVGTLWPDCPVVAIWGTSRCS